MSSPSLEALPSAPPASVPAVADDDVMLAIEGVSKHYKLWTSPSKRLHYSLLSQAHKTLRQVLPKDSAPLAALQRRRDALHQDFTALNALSFQVRRGESLGIIGRNGSGKSTLLQIIAGTLRPSTGCVDVYGRVAALLELGSGFNPEFTGRENIYLNASILGLTKGETNAKFDAIAAFADIGQFLEQPVKTYSSGMVLRLAFAVSINVEPDILIVDEALAVGDVFFTQKCFQRLREIVDAGTTFLFVSHSMAAVQNLCTRAILLKDGHAIFEGPPEEAASRYYATVAAPLGVPEGAAGADPTQGQAPQERLTDLASRSEILQHDILPAARSRHGSQRLEVLAANFLNERSDYSMDVEQGRAATIRFLLRARYAVKGASFGLHIYDRMNELVFAAGARNLGVPLRDLDAGGGTGRGLPRDLERGHRRIHHLARVQRGPGTARWTIPTWASWTTGTKAWGRCSCTRTPPGWRRFTARPAWRSRCCTRDGTPFVLRGQPRAFGDALRHQFAAQEYGGHHRAGQHRGMVRALR